MANFKITLEIDEQGTFITLVDPPRNAVLVKEVVDKEIEKNAIRNVNQQAVIRLATGSGSLRCEKISDATVDSIFNEDIHLDASSDAMNAYVVFRPPVNGGRLLDENEIRSFLDNKGVVFGIDNSMLHSVIKERAHGERYLIASGIPPVKGSDGRIEFMFDKSLEKRLKPVILENGNVDYYNVQNYELTDEGQPLIRIFPAEKGINGLDIYGKEVKCQEGKKPPKIVLGKNVALSNDGMTIVSEVPGQILFNRNRLSVSMVLEIFGNVGPETGNIDFKGTVKVNGNLQSDYIIKAEGNVEIYGVCEGDAIIAEGSVLIAGGVPGMKKSYISAGEHVSAKFISNAEVDAQNNVYSDSIRNCIVRCNGDIELSGKNGAVSGGKVFAKHSISAQIIGSQMAMSTEVYVGVDYEVYDIYTKYRKEYNSLKKKNDVTLKDIAYLEKLSDSEGLSEERRKNLMRLKYSAASCSKQLAKMKPLIAELVRRLKFAQTSGFVHAETTYSGVRLQIGNAVMLLKDDILKAEFVNKNGTVVVNPF